MKNLLVLFLLAGVLVTGQAQEKYAGNQPPGWQIGIGFGEIPYKGSFKPSLTIGYHFNEHFYLGGIYQFKDQIQRDESSFNVQSSGLDGIVSSRENVAQRMMLQGRYTPFRNGPYLSFGVVYNGKDIETMKFADLDRIIDGTEYAGTIGIVQSRPAGWGPAIGIGYQYTFKNGFTLNTEWTPAWFAAIPEPDYQYSGTADLSGETQDYLSKRMTDKFQSTVTNRYKVFHIGIAYRFD